MATTAYTLSSSAWTEVATGPCFATVAKASKNNAGTFNSVGNADPGVQVHIGAGAPAADSFAYHEFSESFNYGGTEKVFMQAISGSVVVKVTPIA